MWLVNLLWPLPYLELDISFLCRSVQRRSSLVISSPGRAVIGQPDRPGHPVIQPHRPSCLYHPIRSRRKPPHRCHRASKSKCLILRPEERLAKKREFSSFPGPAFHHVDKPDRRNGYVFPVYCLSLSLSRELSGLVLFPLSFFHCGSSEWSRWAAYSSLWLSRVRASGRSAEQFVEINKEYGESRCKSVKSTS